MKIAVLSASRKRPLGLIAALKSLDMLASGQHEISYAVSYCDWDKDTKQAAEWMSTQMILYPWRRSDDHITPGEAMNELFLRMDADMYVGFNDDCLPMTYAWDAVVAACAEREMPAACWRESCDPKNMSYIFISRKTAETFGMQPNPPYFPYWFADLWFAEIHHFAFGYRPPIIENLVLGGKRGETQGMRDLRFWTQFFTRTRDQRIAWAQRLAKAYGVRTPPAGPIILACKGWDDDFMSKAEDREARFSPKGEPEEYYLRAKARAEALMSSVAA